MGTTLFIYSTSTDTNSFMLFRQNENNIELKAINDDGTSYKRLLLDTTSGVSLFSCEDVGTNSIVSPVTTSYNSDYSQQLDLTNGGMLYIAATKYFILILSYKPNGAIYGSSIGNGFIGAFEYSRDDGWNIGSGTHSYPSIAWTNGYLAATNWYLPRVKTNASQDVYDTNAYLVPFITNPFPKLVLNASGTATPPAMELRLCNFTTLGYGVLGGIVLGGIKLSANAYGNTADEVQIGGINYFVITCASSGTAANMRLLVPKQ